MTTGYTIEVAFQLLLGSLKICGYCQRAWSLVVINNMPEQAVRSFRFDLTQPHATQSLIYVRIEIDAKLSETFL